MTNAESLIETAIRRVSESEAYVPAPKLPVVRHHLLRNIVCLVPLDITVGLAQRMLTHCLDNLNIPGFNLVHTDEAWTATFIGGTHDPHWRCVRQVYIQVLADAEPHIAEASDMDRLAHTAAYHEMLQHEDQEFMSKALSIADTIEPKKVSAADIAALDVQWEPTDTQVQALVDQFEATTDNPIGTVVYAPSVQFGHQAVMIAAKIKHVDDDQIRQIFLDHGFTVRQGQTDLKAYVFDAAHALLAAASPFGLNNEQITTVWDSMPGGPSQWLKNFGYQQFAHAILLAAIRGPAK